MIGDKFVYKYINVNTPTEKIDYSYSKYDGELFMSAYIKTRVDLIGDQKIDLSALLLF